MSDEIDSFYQLSEWLNDDVYLCAFVVSELHSQRVSINKIYNSFVKLNLKPFKETLALINIMSRDDVVSLSDGLYFDDYEHYLNYLQTLLCANEINFVKYRQKEKVFEDNKKQGVLF